MSSSGVQACPFYLPMMIKGRNDLTLFRFLFLLCIPDSWCLQDSSWFGVLFQTFGFKKAHLAAPAGQQLNSAMLMHHSRCKQFPAEVPPTAQHPNQHRKKRHCMSRAASAANVHLFRRWQEKIVILNKQKSKPPPPRASGSLWNIHTAATPPPVHREDGQIQFFSCIFTVYQP